MEPAGFTKKQLVLLHALCHVNNNQRKALIRNADKSLVKSICEIALNTLLGNVILKDSQKKRLKKHKRVLRKLVACKNKKSNWQRKKRTILQSGGSFLPLLLAPIVDVLVSKLFSAINKN